MTTGRTVFAQLVEFLPVREFRKCVDRYRGEYKVQKITCLDQFLCMAFAQPIFRESLRDIDTENGWEKQAGTGNTDTYSRISVSENVVAAILSRCV